MKSTLEFDLPEDQEYFEAAIKAYDWKMIVEKLDRYFRNHIKHSDDFDSIKGIEMAEEKLWELVQEHDCTF